jgi:hypothetical protein
VTGIVNLSARDQRRIANFNIKASLVRASDAEKNKSAASASAAASMAG